MAERKSIKRTVSARAKDDAIEGSVIVAGALPAPDDLAKYEKIIPGGAGRLLEMAERRTEHQQTLERESLKAEIRGQKWRLAMTFVLALVAGVFGGVLLLNGSEIAGLIIILVDAAALVGVALYGDKSAQE